MLHKEKVKLYLENMDFVDSLFKDPKLCSGSVSEGRSPQSKLSSSYRTDTGKRMAARPILMRLMNNDSNSSIADSQSRKGSRGSFNQEEESQKALKTSSFRTFSNMVKEQGGEETQEEPVETQEGGMQMKEAEMQGSGEQFVEGREFTFGSKRKRKGSPMYSELNSETSSVKEPDGLLEVPVGRGRKRVSFESDLERKETSQQEEKVITMQIPHFASSKDVRQKGLELISEEHDESQDHYVIKKSETMGIEESKSPEIELFKRPGRFAKSRTVANMDEVVVTKRRRLSSNVLKEVKFSDQLKLFSDFLERNKHRLLTAHPKQEYEKTIRRVSSDLAIKYQNKRRKSDHSNSVGISIFDFDFLAPIGKGGFGKVWMVKRRTTDDLYAVKIIKFSTNNPNFIHDLVNENKIMMKVVGDYVVKGIISFMYDRFYCIIMELM
jgi:hypothetical protein